MQTIHPETEIALKQLTAARSAHQNKPSTANRRRLALAEIKLEEAKKTKKERGGRPASPPGKPGRPRTDQHPRRTTRR